MSVPTTATQHLEHLCHADTGDVVSLTSVYDLRPTTKTLFVASFAAGSAAFLIAAYILFPYIAGPLAERLWWHANTAAVAISGLTGLAALAFARRDQLAAPRDVGGRLHTWRLLAFVATGGYLGGFLLLCVLLTPGAPLWYAYSADLVAAMLAVLALAACYFAPIGHWWELFYSMGLLLVLTGAFAFWFPVIDGFFGACLYAFIIVKWAHGAVRRGFPKIQIQGNPIAWLAGFGRPAKRRAARMHEALYTSTLLLGTAPIALLVAFRPYFKPWDTNALRLFGYIMLTGTTIIYTTPIVTSAALLFWCRKYQTLTIDERHHHFTRREHLALVLFGIASYFAIVSYYLGQVFSGPIAYTTMAIAGAGGLLALGSRRRLILFAVLLPIAVAVTLKKLNYIGDFLLPLYVGNQLGY